MKKLINSILILSIFIIGLSACAPADTSSAAAQPEEILAENVEEESTENDAEAPEQEASIEEPAAEPAEEDTEDQQDLWALLDDFLVNPVLVFKENAADMAENEGGQFGFIEVKQFNESENVFEFTSVNEGAYLRLNTLLDEFDENMEQGSSQGILIKFQPPADVNSFYFNFYGQNDSEFGVNFSDGGKPSLFIFMEATMEPFEGELVLESGKTYVLLLALSSDGKVVSIVWDAENVENRSTYISDFSGRQGGENYRNSSRSFSVGFGANDTLKVNEYSIFTFEEIYQ